MRSVQDKSIELISSHKENQVDTDQADTVEASQKTLKIQDSFTAAQFTETTERTALVQKGEAQVSFPVKIYQESGLISKMASPGRPGESTQSAVYEDEFGTTYTQTDETNQNATGSQKLQNQHMVSILVQHDNSSLRQDKTIENEAVSPFTLNNTEMDNDEDEKEKASNKVSAIGGVETDKQGRYKKVNISIRKSVEFLAAKPKEMQPFNAADNLPKADEQHSASTVSPKYVLPAKKHKKNKKR